MYLVRKQLGMSFGEIGHYFGGKDHTTIMHAYRKIDIGIEQDRQTCEAIESILLILQSTTGLGYKTH